VAWIRSACALRLPVISARIASTEPSRPFGAPIALPDCAARAALTASRGSDLPPAAVLPVGAIHLDDPDAGCRHLAGQASAVAAGPLDPGQAHGPEPAQPLQQLAVTGDAAFAPLAEVTASAPTREVERRASWAFTGLQLSDKATYVPALRHSSPKVRANAAHALQLMKSDALLTRRRWRACSQTRMRMCVSAPCGRSRPSALR
jgi:hypothetical protein